MNASDPNKEDLKRIFGIENDNFDIRSTLPPLTTQPPGAWVEKQEFAGKGVSILWLKPGWALIIALTPAALWELTGCPGAIVLLSDADHEPVVSISNEPQLVRYAVTTPAPEPTSHTLSPLEWDALPIGSTLRIVPFRGKSDDAQHG